MRRSVDIVCTDVSEERIDSIFRVVKSASEEPAWPGGVTSQKTAFFIKVDGETLNAQVACDLLSGV
jgi:hypothetical protein